MESMESWHITLCIITLAACYLAAKWINYRKAVKEIEASEATFFREIEAAETRSRLEMDTLKERDAGRPSVPLSKAECETLHLCLVVDAIDARNKEKLILGVRIKDAEKPFRAVLELDPEDYADFDKTLDLAWNSARYSGRSFWAEITLTRREGEIILATITYIAQEEADLPHKPEDSEEMDV